LSRSPPGDGSFFHVTIIFKHFSKGRQAMFKAFALASIFAVSAAATVPANAGDIQGDAYTCDKLWVMKNQIYKSGGFCFKSQRAITYFGNGGCQYDTQAEVPISDMDRNTLKDIRKSQKRLQC
jgi:hypothetical protein